MDGRPNRRNKALFSNSSGVVRVDGTLEQGAIHFCILKFDYTSLLDVPFLLVLYCR